MQANDSKMPAYEDNDLFNNKANEKYGTLLFSGHK